MLLTESRRKPLHLANTDFDTGRMTHAGEYVLTDKAYARLLDELAQKDFAQVTPELRDNILAFYGDPSAPIATKQNAGAWHKTQDEVERLKAFAPTSTPSIQVSTLPYLRSFLQ
jgi:hypothetical protein